MGEQCCVPRGKLGDSGSGEPCIGEERPDEEPRRQPDARFDAALRHRSPDGDPGSNCAEDPYDHSGKHDLGLEGRRIWDQQHEGNDEDDEKDEVCGASDRLSIGQDPRRDSRQAELHRHEEQTNQGCSGACGDDIEVRRAAEKTAKSPQDGEVIILIYPGQARTMT